MSAADPLENLLSGTACPSWCDRASTGHPYRYGLDDSEPPTYHRLHSHQLGTLADGQARLDLHQLEHTSDPDQPGRMDTPEVVLSMAALIAVRSPCPAQRRSWTSSRSCSSRLRS